jgi:hypothetical protein
MADKSEALLQRLERLGQDGVGNYGMPICAEAAAELRRLHKVNQELLEALKLALSAHGVMLLSDPPQEAWKTYGVEQKAGAAIAKAEAK